MKLFLWGIKLKTNFWVFLKTMLRVIRWKKMRSTRVSIIERNKVIQKPKRLQKPAISVAYFRIKHPNIKENLSKNLS